MARSGGAPFSIALTGQVITPDDPGYAEARLVYNSRFSRFPAAIVLCNEPEDVQNGVRWARQQQLPVRARSGGHSYEGWSVVDDGLVLDLGGLNQVAVDLARGEATVGAGVQLLDLYRALNQHGVTVPGGTCPTVGIAGLTLGGGVGFLGRQYGLTCDNLLAVDLVDAEGDQLHASETENPDLFWALRGGGGGNFGIATGFTFRVHPVADVVVFTITWPWSDAPAVLDAWQRWAPFTDERLSVGFAVSHPNQGTVSATGQFNGPAAELPDLIAPLLQTGSPRPPIVSTVPFIAAAEQFAGPPTAHSTFKNSSAMVYDVLPETAITTLMDQMRAAPANVNVVGFFPFGGAIATIAPDATAFVHRRALFDLQYEAYWRIESEAAAAIAWVQTTREAMVPYTRGAYVNYIDADLPDWANAYYGANLARLMTVKATRDADNIFNGPQSIPLLASV